MRRVGKSSFTEIYFAGCNPSFVETSDGYVMIDSPQQPIDAVRWRERMEDKAPIRYLINTEPHGDHILRRSVSASRRPIRTASGWSATRITRRPTRPS